MNDLFIGVVFYFAFMFFGLLFSCYLRFLVYFYPAILYLRVF